LASNVTRLVLEPAGKRPPSINVFLLAPSSRRFFFGPFHNVKKKRHPYNSLPIKDGSMKVISFAFLNVPEPILFSKIRDRSGAFVTHRRVSGGAVDCIKSRSQQIGDNEGPRMSGNPANWSPVTADVALITSSISLLTSPGKRPFSHATRQQHRSN